jgi:hypothetical protein
MRYFYAVACAVLSLASAAGQTQYTVENKLPTYTVVNKTTPAVIVQAEPSPAYRLYQDASGQWWQVPATQAAPVREVRPPLPFSAPTPATIAQDRSGTAASTSGVVGSSPRSTISIPTTTLTGRVPSVVPNGRTRTLPQQACVGFV